MTDGTKSRLTAGATPRPFFNMLGYIYAGLWILCIFFLIMGYAFNGDADIMLYLAYGFIFLLSMMLIPGTPGGLEFVNETATYYQYGDNYSGYHWDYVNPAPTNKDPVNIFHTYETKTYDTYKNAIFGFYLSLFSLFGFISVFMKRQNVDFGDSL